MLFFVIKIKIIFHNKRVKMIIFLQIVIKNQYFILEKQKLSSYALSVNAWSSLSTAEVTEVR